MLVRELSATRSDDGGGVSGLADSRRLGRIYVARQSRIPCFSGCSIASWILTGTHQQPHLHLFVVMLILSSTWILRRFLGDFLGTLRAPALSREILGPHPRWSTVFSSISLRNVWICRCQTFNVFPIFVAFEAWTFFYIGLDLVGSDMLAKTR